MATKRKKAPVKRKKAATRTRKIIIVQRPRTPKTPKSKAARHIKEATKAYTLELGKLSTAKILAKRKTDRNKIQKKITEVSSRIRKMHK